MQTVGAELLQGLRPGDRSEPAFTGSPFWPCAETAETPEEKPRGLLCLEITASFWGIGATCHLLLKSSQDRGAEANPLEKSSVRPGRVWTACMSTASLCRRANYRADKERDLASGSVVTHDHRPGGLEQWKFPLSLTAPEAGSLKSRCPRGRALSPSFRWRWRSWAPRLTAASRPPCVAVPPPCVRLPVALPACVSSSRTQSYRMTGPP